jgi:hypothetical protein
MQIAARCQNKTRNLKIEFVIYLYTEHTQSDTFEDRMNNFSGITGGGMVVVEIEIDICGDVYSF